ncbi:T9SS type A sorting domain-containing protein [candidate division KSB1 bacterium]|nr:T9SS type A sorting domain-containing protein [candidate division KSB1 bacterium]
MKRFGLLVLMLAFILPLSLYAITYVKINGVAEYTVTSLPANLTVTCDLAQAGNRVSWEAYIDFNGNKIIDGNDERVDFMYLTDGIGWIRDPENPDNDIPGDETGVDGKIQNTETLNLEDMNFAKIQFILRMVDQDGSSAQALAIMDIAPHAPYISGKITDNQTGAAIAGAIILGNKAMNEGDNAFAVSDIDGTYIMQLPSAGTWGLVAGTFFLNNDYQPSDTTWITIGSEETKTQDFALDPYDAFVEGSVKKLDGTPVAGISVTAYSEDTDFFGIAFTDQNGNYRLGVFPGTVMVGCSQLFNMVAGSENWPEGYYADPVIDTLQVVQGQTARSDFTFLKYRCFVTGNCTVNGQGIGGVEITAVSINTQTFEMTIYQTTTKSDGSYKLGVHPGTLMSLIATKEGYSVDPMIGYQGIVILTGQTLAGYDFQLTPQTGSISIGGNVTYDGGAAAPDIYVVAYAEDFGGPEGFLIEYTDANGAYQFENMLPEYWRVGVYKAGYSSTPAIITQYLMPGSNLNDQNFVLSEGSGVNPFENSTIPRAFSVFQNFPNPFNPTTSINYTLPEKTQVQVTVYNVAGQFVANVINAVQEAGIQTVQWDGKNQAGVNMPSGTYFYRITAGKQNAIRKMLLVR